MSDLISVSRQRCGAFFPTRRVPRHRRGNIEYNFFFFLFLHLVPTFSSLASILSKFSFFSLQLLSFTFSLKLSLSDPLPTGLFSLPHKTFFAEIGRRPFFLFLSNTSIPISDVCLFSVLRDLFLPVIPPYFSFRRPLIPLFGDPQNYSVSCTNESIKEVSPNLSCPPSP